MSESAQPTAVAGLAIEAVEWLASGTDAGLVRVRGRWADPADRPVELPALCVRVGAEVRRFGSLPDVRFGRDPALWRGSYLVPAVLAERGPEALWLVLADGREVSLPALQGAGPPERVAPEPASASAAPPGGAVIDRAVLAEKRARRAEEAERAQARRAAEALKAVEALELRSAELERRLDAPPEEDPPSVAPEATQAALESALTSLAGLRTALHDQRLRLRSSELQRAADAVALVALREELADVAALRATLRERAGALEAATARAQAAEAAVSAVREQAAEQVAAASRRAALDAGAVRRRAAAELRAAEEGAAAARAAAHAAREELEAVTETLASERAAHRAARDRVEAREAELRELAAALEGARAELEGARTEAAERGRALDRRIAALEEALAGERERLLAVGTELATARAALAAATAERRAEFVARAALEARLEEERAALAEARAGLARAERAPAGAVDRWRAVQAAAPPAPAEAEAAEAHADGGRPIADGLQARIAQIERTASPADLERHAAEQSAAAATAQRSAPSPALAADLDAAAAALRARAGSAPQAGDLGSARPWLRGALARQAHDDPATAARLLAALAPALGAVTARPLDFDLTIRGGGTYAITSRGAETAVRPLARPRGRREAAFHATASPETLAELLAGARKRIGRWQGSVRVAGRRGEALALVEALGSARLSLAAAAGAGADLPPDLVFAAFPYAIDPAWTRGHRFTVAQELIDVPGAPFVIAAHDGEPLTVARSLPAGGADATVSMTRATFAALLRGTPATGERRPVVRGDRAAVAALKAWTDRAQGIAR